MSLAAKVKEVERLFKTIDEDIAKFQEKSKLGCISGCGECCKKPDIEATVLEMLPYAYYLYKNKKAEDQWEKLKENTAAICILFTSPVGSQKGFCSEYTSRGFICRLFGFSAVLDKTGQPELATCKYIKTSQAEAYQQTVEAIKRGEHVPVMSEYYMKLYGIDANLSTKFYPINTAIRLAIEEVMSYFAYRSDEVLEQEEEGL